MYFLRNVGKVYQKLPAMLEQLPCPDPRLPAILLRAYREMAAVEKALLASWPLLCVSLTMVSASGEEDLAERRS